MFGVIHRLTCTCLFQNNIKDKLVLLHLPLTGQVSAMGDPLVSAVDHETVEQIKFVAYSVVAYVIVAIGMLGNVLSLVVLTRPNLKVGIRLLSKETDLCPGCDVCVPVGLGRVQPVRSDHCSPCPL